LTWFIVFDYLKKVKEKILYGFEKFKVFLKNLKQYLIVFSQNIKQIDIIHYLNFKFLSIVIMLLALPFTLAAVKTQQNTTQHAAQSSGTPVYLGVFPSQVPNINSVIDFQSHAKKGVAIVNFFTIWGKTDGSQNFQQTWMDSIRANGSIPMITWQPGDANNTASNSAYSLASIYNGKFDNYIKQFAQDAQSWNHPFFLRFAHEMNGSWYSWSEKNSGNNPGDYVLAWRHVHDIFMQNNVRNNATWVWCPNVEYNVGQVNGSIPLNGLYPGDQYADWICMDGYNHGKVNFFSWQTFSQVFKSTYDNLTTNPNLGPSKPLMIGETASEYVGGDKSAWITDAFVTQIPNNFPKIKAVLWFDKVVDGYNWPIELPVDGSSEIAFSNAVYSPCYVGNQYSNFNTSPIPVAANFPCVRNTKPPIPAPSQPSISLQPINNIPSSPTCISSDGRKGSCYINNSCTNRQDQFSAQSSGCPAKTPSGIPYRICCVLKANSSINSNQNKVYRNRFFLY